MCNIWKERKKEDITRDCLIKYRNSPFGKNLRILDITGGEPFLCDLPSIIKTLDNGEIRTILISTNGFLTEKIVEDVRRILEITKSNLIIDVSVDGIGKIHDQIRGIKGAYERALNTINKLRELSRDRIRVSLKMTILKENIDQIMECYKNAEELKIDFTCKPGTNFGFLRNEDMNFDLNKDDYEKIIKILEEIQILRTEATNFGGKSFWDRFFTISNDLFGEKLIEYYKNIYEDKVCMIVPCYSSFLSIMLHHDSVVYSCPTLMKKMGEVFKESFESVWISKDAKRIRNFINEKRCACFSQCDQMPSIVIGNTPKVVKKMVLSYIKK
jgi:MoaA/NifB/PqqE/SkfB family radical SAM enzyme